MAGTPNRSTAEVKALAQAFGADAIETLAEIMKDSPNDAARIAAARELLDRAYGRPVQQIAGDPDGAPVSLAVEIMQTLQGTGRGLPSDSADGAP